MKVTMNCLIALEGTSALNMMDDLRNRLKVVDMELYEQAMPGNGIMLIVVHPNENKLAAMQKEASL